ncbi:MAG: MgtC/SapB family protein [Dehalococcoidia bacterium]|nr:MgtC/SapB family protein [Dehalococcoidia bacterium]
MEGTDLVLIGRAALAAALGFLIGWERERRGSPAGDRTYAMVALGAAAFTTIAVDDFPDRAAQLIAGVVTGVGFLGAGVVMRQGTGEVRGLTTAASLWAIAAIGVVVGAGDYVMGTLLAGLIYLILVWERLPLLSRIGHTKRAPSDPASTGAQVGESEAGP